MNRFVLSALALLLTASPALAQTHVGSTMPAQDRVGILAFVSVDQLNIASSQTFDAVFGTSKIGALGAGVDIVNIWKHAFVRVAASKASKDGERVVVVNNVAYKLGTTLSMDMTPTELGAGWRFRAGERFTPYVGAALVLLNYKENSAFADVSENVSNTLHGVGMFGGVDVRVLRQVSAGVEAQYRSINSAPTATSAAGSFGEKNLGGVVLRARLAIRF